MYDNICKFLAEKFSSDFACWIFGEPKGLTKLSPTEIDKLKDGKEQINIAAATSILAGLVLNKEVIKQVLREEIMQESVIYQDIKEQGIKQGLQQGQANLVLRLLKRRIGEVESGDETRITELSVEQLEALGEALLDFSSRDDLLTWLADT